MENLFSGITYSNLTLHIRTDAYCSHFFSQSARVRNLNFEPLLSSEWTNRLGEPPSLARTFCSDPLPTSLCCFKVYKDEIRTPHD